jgi:hypothetical protein
MNHFRVVDILASLVSTEYPDVDVQSPRFYLVRPDMGEDVRMVAADEPTAGGLQLVHSEVAIRRPGSHRSPFL